MGFTTEIVKKIRRRGTFEFDRSDMDLYKFFPHLRGLLALNGIFLNNRNSRLRFVLPAIVTGVATCGFVLEAIAFLHYLLVKDYRIAIECFCYTVLVGGIPIVTISVHLNNNDIFNLIENMNKDFVSFCSMGSKYRQSFLKVQLQIWHMYTAWMMLVMFGGVLFAVSPVLQLSYQALFETQDEHTIRPLRYPVWLPYDDPYRTPNYEIFLFFECFLSLFFVLTFDVIIYVLFHVLLHNYSVLVMMFLDLEAIFDGLDQTVATLPRVHERRREVQLELNKRIGRIVNMHVSVIRGIKTASFVYGPTLAYLVSVVAWIVCIVLYQGATKLEEGVIDLFAIVLGTASCVGLWIPCYLGTLVRNKAFGVGDACWNCGWHSTSLGQLVRTDLTIIMQQAQRPITIKYTGLPSIEMETFSAEMSKAYSYFNMLRQN